MSAANWENYFTAFTLHAHVQRHGKDAVHDALRFIYALVHTHEQQPEQRTMSLPLASDQAWHDLILDERLYAAIILTLTAHTKQERPWHMPVPAVNYEERVDKWYATRERLFGVPHPNPAEEGAWAEQAPTNIEFTCQDLAGNVFRVRGQTDWTVSQLKHALQPMISLPPDQLRLIYNGRQLDDFTDRSLFRYYNYHAGDTITLVQAMRGC